MARTHAAIIRSHFNRIPEDIRDALTMLEWLGSTSDPVTYRGQEIEALELDGLVGDKAPSEIRLSYAGGSPNYRWVRGGSLLGMIADRVILDGKLERKPRRKATPLEQLGHHWKPASERLDIARQEIIRLQDLVRELRAPRR